MKKLCSILLAVCVMAGLAALSAVPAAALDPYDPSNLTSLSMHELLDYFNLAVNRVRTEKPGFQQRESLRIADVKTSALGGAMDSLLITLMKELLPGDWVPTDVVAGQSNVDLFMSENTNASDLRPQDITSISAKMVGSNWVIELRVKEETNPAQGLNSSNGRIFPVATREKIIEDMNGTGVTANQANTTLRYGSGFACITVNGQGRVIAAANGFQMNALFKKVQVSFVAIDMAITYNSEWQYAYFDWAPEEPFPPANTFPAAGSVTFEATAPKWWQLLPGWLQWILRWVFFGWIWMK